MAKNHSETQPFGSALFAFLKKIFGVLAGTRPFFDNLADMLEHRAEQMERRLLKLVVLYLLTFASLVFLLLGIFFIVIDSAGVSRGIVFAVGGLIVLLVTVILIQSMKNNGGGHESQN